MIRFEGKYPIKTWNVPSKDGKTIHLVELWSEGKLTCNCPASVFTKKICRHRREIETEISSQFGSVMGYTQLLRIKKKNENKV